MLLRHIKMLVMLPTQQPNFTRFQNNLMNSSSICCDTLVHVQQLQIVIHILFIIIASGIMIVMKYFTELRYYDYKFLLHYPGHAFKWTISGILIVVLFFSAAEGILTDLSRNDVTNLYLYIPQMLSLLGLIISLMYYHHMEYWDRPHLAWLLLLYWIMAIIGEVLAIFRVSQSIGFNYSILRLDVGIITTILYCCCAAVEINVLHKKIVCPFSEEKIFPKDFVETNLYYMQSYVNILSNATIWWLNWLVSLSRRQTIVLDDLGCLPGEFEGKRMIEAFNKVYRYEQQNCGKRVPSLWKVYWRTHYTMIIRVCVLRFIHSALTFVGPACLGKIVMYATEYYANDIKIYSSPFVTVDEFFSNGFILVLLIFTILVIRNTLYVYLYGISTIIGLQLKTALQNLVYEKTLRLPLQSTDDTTVGKTINHMSVDVTVIQIFFTLFLGFVLANPLHILIVSIWLLYLMGIAGVVGICVLLLIMPLALKTARMQHKLQHVNMHHSDIRVKKTNELLQGIKLLKLSGWEELFASNITNTRSEEMKLTSKVAMYFLLSGLLSQALPWIIALTMFAVYSQLDTEPLTPDVVFTTLVLINFLSQPLFVMPSFAKYTIDMVAATKRLAHFLSVDEIEGNAEHRSIVDGRMDSGCLHELTEEYEMNTIEMKPTTPLVQRVQRHNYQTTHEINQLPITATAGHIETDVAIEIVNGYFSWGRSTYEAVLNNINVKIKTGTLTIVVGKIGTGKSSLVSAILGEMNTISGSVTFNGRDNRIAYVAQKAWLQNASLRDNILFGETYVRERYNTVLQVCALNADLRSLPGGDMTEIGERGINMSGGQKHRICLARALYSNTDVVILDDPLSALDVHVSTHIMENAILGYLREQQRTVILVTHQIQHLEHANQVLVMENGQIIKKGDLREIRSHNIEMYRQWKELISTISESENENENELVTKKDLGLYSGTFKAPKPSTLVEDESSPVGVGWYMVYLYLRALKLPRVGVLVLVILLTIVTYVFLNMWISNWSQAGQDSLNETKVEQEMVVTYYLPRCSIFICLYIMMSAITNACLFIFCISAAKRLFNQLLYNVIYSPIRFFETTPVGRLLNRFSADVRSVDQSFCDNLSVLLGAITVLAGTYALNAIISPYFILLMIPVAVISVVCIIVGSRLPRDLKRLENITLSPVLSSFGETCTGLSTIRAIRANKRFTEHMLETININNLCRLYYAAAMKWFNLRVNTIGAFLFLIFGIGALLACINMNISPSAVGMAVTTGLIGTNMLNLILIFIIDVLSFFNGIERVLEYANMTPEELEGTVSPPNNWPSRGSINIQNITARYAIGLDPVLTNVSVKIRPGEKVGICGRTGSGKSSLTLTLLRMIDIIEGRIIIDGIDISKISVLTLRRRMSIIPQDPVLFCGTLRFNLDPEEKYGDQDLWNALEIAQLKDCVLEMDEQLDTIVTDGGDNISTGQRQLICLARAFLRKSRILIMDEATASVDFETDATLQAVIATAFSDKTVLTIAHRISTILDSDTVLVLSEGRVVEYGTPQKLLRKDGGMFASLVNNTE